MPHVQIVTCNYSNVGPHCSVVLKQRCIVQNKNRVRIWLISQLQRSSSKFWRCISQQYSGVFCLRGYANWIHQKAWCGTTNADFVIKLSKQPKQHQIQRLIIPVLPFFPSDGTHCLTVRDICGHSTVYTVRQTQNSNEEQPWNRTAGRGDYHLKRLPIDQALQRLESRAAIHRIRRSRPRGRDGTGPPRPACPASPADAEHQDSADGTIHQGLQFHTG
jgi:hypothetical protein